MTKAELVRKLARKTGVPDSEAKVFYEIFLQQLSTLLSPGEGIELKGLGFFLLKKGKIKNAAPGAKEDLYSDFIVYSPSIEETDNINEILIFNVPASKAVPYNLVDSYFSLSAGKPVIPLRGVKNVEFFIPPSGTELRRLLETKVENLLSQSELLKNYSTGSEFLYISPESYNASQSEINWNEFTDKQRETKTGIDSVPWDFGDDLSRQIEEESLLDIGREETEIPSLENESVSWDFGSNYFKEDIEFPPNIPDEIPQEPGTTTEQPEGSKNFKRIKSFTKEHKIKKSPGLITRSEDNLSWDFGEKGNKSTTEIKDDDFYKNHYSDAVPDEKGYTEVVNKRKTYDIELSSRDQARLDSIIKEEMQKPEEPETSDVTAGFYKEEKKNPTKKETVSSYDRDYYSRRRSTPVFFIALFVIVAVGAALFLFLKKSTSNINVPGEPQQVVSKSSSPIIISRSFDIPVTYPYAKKEDLAEINLPPVIKTETNVPKPAEVNKPEQVSAPENIVRDASPGSVKIKNNLFKDGNTYSVQVSSWKSRSIAESEAGKLRNKGLDGVVERAQVPGRGLWYRVKIINIKTQAEAEKYLN